MTSYPMVSCLMPTTPGRAKFWERAVSMFLAQDYPDKELIVIDEGGEFRHRTIDERGVLRRRSKQGTLGEKLNYGARSSAGDVLINWDDDDWNAPNRISTQVQHMQISGKPFVGFSSLIYYAEGQDHGYEYTGNAWYASGSTHCYTREWALAHPRPDMTVGEDNVAVEEAHRLDALSTLSGMKVLVACDHPDNCSSRLFGTEMFDLIRNTADNYRKVPLAEFASTIRTA